jgi:hypothetical protein
MKYKFDDSIDEYGKQKHIHTLNGKALIGTSTVLNVLSKPLTWWASGLACAELGWLQPKEYLPEEVIEKAGKSLEEIKNMSVEEYIKLLNKAYRAHSVKLDKTAKKGTDLHEELSKYVKSKIEKSNIPDIEFDGKILPFIAWANNNVKEFIASETYCYSERLWIGGIVDCVAVLKDGTTAIIDFKSAKEAYDSHFLQCAGYDLQISENGILTKEGGLIKKIDKIDSYIVVPFGAKVVMPTIKNNTDDYKKGFESALVLYKLMNK